MIFISQTEQQGGFWLVNLQKEDYLPLPIGFSFEIAKQPLVLFQQTQTSYQFLTQAPLDETALLALSKLKFAVDADNENVPTTPAWQIFAQNMPQTKVNSKAFQEGMTGNNSNEAHEDNNPPCGLVLLAKDLSMASLFYFSKLAQTSEKEPLPMIALLEASHAFPFQVKPAQFLFQDFPEEAIGACPLLEDWKIPNRLCSPQGQIGCYDGSIDSLLSEWHPPENWALLDFRQAFENNL